MTKEEIFEELLAKRSATPDNAGPVWHETGGLDVEQLKIGNLFIFHEVKFAQFNHFHLFA